MRHYAHQTKLLLAVDCIVFGFDGRSLKLLLIKRGFQPKKGQWSLMGGFVSKNETAEDAAARVVTELTDLKNIYLEQLSTFTTPRRDPVERTVSIAYLALINLQDYTPPLSPDYHAQWFSLNELPTLIFDHSNMVAVARKKLEEKTRLQPLLIELLPNQFTLPQLQSLYEQVFDKHLDKRNFTRKMLSTRLLVQLKNKDKSSSRRGAFFYTINRKKYARLLKNIL